MKYLLFILFSIYCSFCYCQVGDCIGCDTPKDNISTIFNSPKADKIEVSIFPNPTSEFLNISDNSNSIKELRIFSLLGSNVRNLDIGLQSRFNISDLPKGFYLLQMVNSHGDLVKTIRLKKI